MVRSRGWDAARSRQIAEAAMSATGGSLAAALVEALKELTVVEAARTAKIPTKDGGSYSYKYADISDAIKVTRPVLAAHGIVALTPVHDHGDGLACTVVLLHTSGERLDLGPFPFPHGRDAQATGSMVTYHRRYALVAALGMAAGDDDDGRSAAPRERQSQRPAPPPPFDVAKFTQACTDLGLDPADVLAHAEIYRKLEELTEADRPALKASLAALTEKEPQGVTG